MVRYGMTKTAQLVVARLAAQRGVEEAEMENFPAVRQSDRGRVFAPSLGDQRLRATRGRRRRENGRVAVFRHIASSVRSAGSLRSTLST